ncbi:MAG: adenylate cyclase [Patiriisocius sp.]|jgi:adenylate cyclase
MKNIHLYFKRVFKHIVIWTFAFAFFTILREYGQVVKDGLSERLTLLEHIQFQVLTGLIAGILFGSYAYVIDRFMSRRFSFGRTVLISSLGYVVVILSLIFLSFTMVSNLIDTSMGKEDLKQFFESGNHRVLIIFCFVIGFLIEFVQEIDRKFGPGNLWRMLKGTYYHPIQEERVLMFLDMRSSTTIAEQLGHMKYSRLVQDCFKDISVIADHQGQVYQYVGDEAVLTWKGQTAFNNNNCVNAYYAFCDRLEARKEYYISNYGLLPEFKAGMNVGMVMTAEVGEIKREIAFHGDTINTAARIQGKCNELGSDFLASRLVIDRLADDGSIEMNSVGELELKGKNTRVEILAIERIEGN